MDRSQIDGVIAAILAADVASAEAFDDPPVSDLFPDEQAVISGAVESRQREFGTGRQCARLAMAKLGVAPVALLPGEAGAPQWPSGIVGSITHCAGYRAAAVASSTTMHSLGIDAEPDAALPDGVIERVASGDERHQVAELAVERPDVSWDRVLFSCKEAVYKAWFPLARQWLGFGQVAVTMDVATSTFAARLLVPGPVIDGAELHGFGGRWTARRGLLVAAVSVPAATVHDLSTGERPIRL